MQSPEPPLHSHLCPRLLCSLVEEAVVLSSDLSPRQQAAIVQTWLLCLSLTHISLVDGHKFDSNVELLIYYSEVQTPSVAVEMGRPITNTAISFLPVYLPPKE